MLALHVFVAADVAIKYDQRQQKGSEVNNYVMTEKNVLMEKSTIKTSIYTMPYGEDDVCALIMSIVPVTKRLAEIQISIII